MSDEEKCELILEWAENMPDFDTSFVLEMQDRLMERELTPAQSGALDNIIERWNIK